MDDLEGEQLEPLSIIGTGLAAAAQNDAVAAEGAKLGARLFGPIFDEKGRQWAEGSRQKHLLKTMQKADRRAVGDNPGTIPLRLAEPVLRAAEYAENEVITEYLSGVLASSRSPTGGDDRGIGYASLIARLSSDQLRLHYLIYASLRPTLCATHETVATKFHQTSWMFDQGMLARAFTEVVADRDEVMAAAIDGLLQEDLIGPSYSWGSRAEMEEDLDPRMMLATDWDPVASISISVHGMRLFMWAMGAGSHRLDNFLDPAVFIGLVEPDPTLPLVPTTSWSDSIVPRPVAGSDSVDG